MTQTVLKYTKSSTTLEQYKQEAKPKRAVKKLNSVEQQYYLFWTNNTCI